MSRTFAVELRRSLEGCRLRLSFGLLLFDRGFSLDLFGYFIPLLFLDRWRYDPHEIVESWGFSTVDRSFHFNWGSRCRVWRFPWERRQIAVEVRRPDGTWVPYVGSYERDKEPDGRELLTYPYRYTLRSGEVQERLATVYVERRSSGWRWSWLNWLPGVRSVSQSIWVEFNGEVGERTGSWKGGVVGCGAELLPGDTPLNALRRMERERQFT